MKIINSFVDTNIVNRILDIEVSKPRNLPYEEDRLYLTKIIKGYVERGVIKLVANPTIKQQIESTSDLQRRVLLLDKLAHISFISFNKSIFPFAFPVTFITDIETSMLQELESEISKGFNKDEKVFLDALSNEDIDVLLTTDRDDLANEKLSEYITKNGLTLDIKIFTPKDFYEYLQTVDFTS